MPRYVDPRTPWRIEFFQRHRADDPSRAVPARAFLDASPAGVRADMLAVIKAVADAPPPRFAGGGKWEAMHGDMKGFTRSASQDRSAASTGCSASSSVKGFDHRGQR